MARHKQTWWTVVRGKVAAVAAVLALVVTGFVVAPAVAADDEVSALLSIDKSYGTGTGIVDDSAEGAVVPTVTPGVPFSYTINVTCSVLDAFGCYGATVTDALPAPLVLSGTTPVTAQGGTVTLAADRRSFTVRYLSPIADSGGEVGLPDGQARTIVVEVVVPTGTSADLAGVVVNEAELTATNAVTVDDPAPVDVVIPDAWGVGILKDASPASVAALPGRTVTYTVTAANTSNRSVDELVVTDPSDGSNPFAALELTGIGAVTAPAGATHVRVDVRTAGGWTDGTQATVAGLDPSTLLPGGVALTDVTGVRVTFLDADGGTLPPASLTDGAGSFTLTTQVREDATFAEGTTTLTNTASASAVEGGTARATRTDPASVAVRNVPPSVDVTKRFGVTAPTDHHVLPVGSSTTVTVAATNTGRPVTSLTVTEPSTGTFEDQGLAFGGFVPADDDDGVEWPDGATAASVTYRLLDGGTVGPLPTTSKHTLPAAPDPALVAGFTVTFTGDIDSEEAATLPFTVTALEIPFTPGTDPGDRPATNAVDAQVVASDGSDATDDATALVTTRPLRVLSDVVKTIGRAESWAVPGVRVPVSLAASVSPASTIGSELLEVTDGPGGEFWDVMDLAGFTNVPVPAGTSMTIRYYDGSDWVVVPGAENVTTSPFSLVPDAAVRTAAQGVRFTFVPTAPGGLLDPGFLVTPTFTAQVRETTRVDGDDISELALAAGEDGLGVTNSATVRVRNDDPSVPVPGHSTGDTDETSLLPLDCEGCGPDLVDKTWDAENLVAQSDVVTSPRIGWTTGGLPFDTVVVADPAVSPADATTVPDLTSTAYDAFDLVRVRPITPATDPAIASDRVTKVEIATVDDGWVDVTTQACATAAACTGTFPGLELTPAQQEVAIGVRLTFASANASGVVTEGEGLRPIDLDVRLRRTLRSDPAVPVVGNQIGLEYNVAGSPGLVRNTVAVTGRIGATATTSTDDADANIIETDLNISLDKTIDDDPGSNVPRADQAHVGLPPAGVADGDFPTVDVRLATTNSSSGGARTLVVADPVSTGAGTGAGTMYDYFDLVAVRALGVPAAAATPGASVSSEVVLTYAGGTTSAPMTIADVLALDAAALADVVGLQVLHEGQIAAGTGVSEEMALLTFRLRATVRSSGDPVAPGTTGHLVDNVADVALTRLAPGTSIEDVFPGLAPALTGLLVQEDEAAADVLVEQPTYGVTLHKEIADSVAADPATSGSRDHVRAEGTTAPVTVTLQARPTGTVQTRVLTVTDTAPTFFNVFTLGTLRPVTMPASVHQLRVSVLTTSGATPVVLAQDGAGTSVTTTCAGSTVLDDCWVEGVWQTAAGTTVTPQLPAGVTAADVVGIRYELRVDEASSAWQRPARPRVTIAFDAVRRTTLRSDTARAVPSTLPELMIKAPGETVLGLTSNDATSVATGSWPTTTGQPWSAEDDAADATLLRHLTTSLRVTKSPGSGTAASLGQQLGSRIPYALTITNTGERGITDPKIVDEIGTDGLGSLLVEPDLFDPAKGADSPIYTFTLDGAAVAGFDASLDATTGVLSVTVPSGFVLASGSTLVVGTGLVFREGLLAETPVANTVTVTADRALDVCEYTENLGALQEETSRGTTCAASTLVHPNASAPLRVTKSVKGVGAGDPAADPGDANYDDLGVKAVGTGVNGLADACQAPNAGDGTHYIHPCVPITRPGGVEEWKLTFVNSGNVRADRVVAIDVLPQRGDRGVLIDAARGSQFRTTIAGDGSFSVEADGGPTPTATVYYTTQWPLSTTCNRNDLTSSVAGSTAACAVGRWLPVADADEDELAEATAVKLVVTYATGDGLPAGKALDLTFHTRTAAFAPVATSSEPIAYNSVAFASRGVLDAGGFVTTPPLEPRKVGVAMATGRLALAKTVETPSPWRATTQMPATYPFRLACTSAGEDVVLAGTAGSVVGGSFTVPVPSDGTVLTVGGANLNLPLFADCTVTEPELVGSTPSFAPSADGGATASHVTAIASLGARTDIHAPWTTADPVGTFDVTNTYANSGFTVRKTVDDGGARDEGGALVERTGWRYGFTASCLFLGSEVLSSTLVDGESERSFTLAAGESRAFTSIPVGSVCTVTESQRHGAQQTTVAVAGAGADTTGHAQPTAGTRFTVEGPGDTTGAGTATAATVTAANTFTTGSVRVRKTFTGETGWAYGNVELRLVCTITQPVTPSPRTVYDKVWTLTTPTALDVTVGDLPTGATCTLTEPKNAGSTTRTFTPATGVVTVGATGTTVDVSAANRFGVGTVSVTKALTGPGSALSPATGGFYTFRLLCTRTVDGVTGLAVTVPDGADRTVTGAGTATWTGLPTGASCTVSEVSATLADGTVLVAGTHYTASSPASVTVGDGTTVSRTLTNSFASGSLRVLKSVTGAAAGWAPSSFTAQVACTWHGTPVPLANGGVVTVTPAAPGTVTGIPLDSSCTVAETGTHGATAVSYSPSATVTVPTTTVVDLTVTNRYDPSGLVVTKAVATDALDAEGEPVEIGRSFTFDVSCSLAGTTRSTFFTLADGASRTLTELPDGVPLPVGADCTVTERSAGDTSSPAVVVTGATPTSVPSGARVTLPALTDGRLTAVGFEFTNTYPTGSVQVTKSIAGAGAAWATAPFTVRLVCTAAGAGTAGTDLVVLDATHTFTPGTPASWTSQTWTVDDVLAGASCVVTETATGGATSTVVGSAVTVTDGGTATVGVTNTFTLGDLEVTKELVGNPGDLTVARNGTYTVQLVCTRDVDGDDVPVVVPGGATRVISFATSPTVRYEDLPTGADCTLTETGSVPQAQTTSYTVDGVLATGTGAALTVGSTSDVEVVVTNGFGTTSVVIAKVVSSEIPARYVPADFEVTLTCDWFGEDVSPAAPVTVPAGGSVTVDGLPVGSTCAVAETGAHGATAVTYTVTQPGETTGTVTTPDDLEPIAGATPFTTFTVTNSYDLSAGFRLEKVSETDAVDASGAPVVITRAFRFDIACTFLGEPVTEVATEVTILNGGGGDLVGHMPVGSVCTVTERATGDASEASISVTGDPAATTSGRTATFTVGAGTTVAPSVTAAFTNTYPVGAVEVTKVITGDGGVLADGTPVWAVGPFTLDMVCTLPGAAGGAAVDLVVWDGSHTFERSDADGPWTTADLTWRQEDLPVGAECVVTEPTRGGANAVAFTAPDGTVTADDPSGTPATEASATVVVTDDLADPVEVAATNTFTLGALEVTKQIEGPTAPTLAPALDGAYEVTFVCTRPVDGTQVPVAVPGGATRTFTGTGTTRTVTYEGLPTGATCELTETTSAPAPQTVEYTVGSGAPSTTPPSFEVLEGTATAGVTVTNTFLDGTVVARKLVVGDGKDHAPADFTATITCTWEGTTVPLPDGGRVTLPGDGTVVPVGDAPEGSVCSIVEDTTTGGQTDVEVSDPVTLVAGETSTLTVTNTYELTGLSVTKQVVGATSADGTPVTYTTAFAFTVGCLFRGTEVVAPADREFTLVQGAVREIGGVPVGSTCTVTETDAAGATSTTVTQVADDVAGETAAGSTTTLTLVRGVDHDVVVTNTLPTGPVTVTKVVEGAGAGAWGTGTFEVRLVCVAEDVVGGTVHDALHELSAASPTLTVGHLPAGATCEVTETRTGGADASVVTVGSQAVTDATDPGATPASFTVTNTFDVAAITVTKKVEGDGASGARDTEFVVELVCTREVDGDAVEIVVPGGARRTLSRADGLTTRYAGLPAAASCEITEVVTGDADATSIVVVQDGAESGATGTSADVALTGSDVQVTVVNTFDDDGGSVPVEDDPELPVSGAQVLGAVGLAVLLLLMGFALVVVRRRRA